MVSGPRSGRFAARVELTDGTVALVRHVHPRDADGLLRFLQRLSPTSVYLRFCSGGANLRAAMLAFIQVREDKVGFVAYDLDGEIVGHAEYVRLPSCRQAEVAVVLSDEMQGKGLARQLVRVLAADASTRGVDEFVATVLPTNGAMLTVFRRAFGARIIEDADSTVCEVAFATAVPPVVAVPAAGGAQRRAA